MLTEAQDAARAAGRVVISDTATPGLLGRTAAAMSRALERLGDGPTGRRVTGIGAAGSSISTQLPERVEPSWRNIATELASITHQNQTGVLISLDEIHAVDRAELTALAADVQHPIRDELPIGLIVAGIPEAVSDLLNDKVSTFLRRTDRVDLTDVALEHVTAAFAETFRGTGVKITDEQAARAARATGGYPFLVQPVGYHIWRRSVEGELRDEDVASGIEAASILLGATVLQPALSDLSAVDRTHLLKMAEDDGPSETRTVAATMNQSVKYGSVYRQRLLDAGMIVDAGVGRVDFAVPGLRDYLREHAASTYGVR